MRSLTLSGALGGLLLAGAATGAQAQGAPAPIGFWATANGAEQLTITATGCSLANAQGQPVTSGPCSWNPSSTGGILTIMSSQTYKPAPIYYNVVWVNQTTITVDGDVFTRRQ
jgi:hypothetical protein